MILVDTSIWVNYFRHNDTLLKKLLNAHQVLTHSYVIGELALGHLQQRNLILKTLQDLPQAPIASTEEILKFIHREKLFGLGIGYIDVHLLAAVLLRPGTSLWTRDKCLQAVAHHLSLAAPIQDSTLITLSSYS